jgi:hypothetical protein
MPSICVPDTTGDVKLTWNPENPDEVKHAKDHFEALRKSGHIFFRIESDGKKGAKIKKFDDGLGEVLCEFDPNADVMGTKLPSGG